MKIVLGGWLIFFSTAFAQLDMQWVELYGEENNDMIYDHIETADGGFAFTGYTKPDNQVANKGGVWLGKADRDGERLWSYRHNYEDNYSYGYTLFEQDDGGFLIIGYERFEGEDRFDRLDKILVLKTNAEGDSVLWLKHYGGEVWERGFKAIRTEDGGYAIAGATTSIGGGLEDFFLLKLDENCDSLRSYVGQYRGRATCQARTIQEMSNGSFIVSGSMQDAVQYSNHTKIWTLALDQEANRLWQRVAGTDTTQRDIAGYNSCFLTDSSIAITGRHKISPEFGSPRGKLWVLEMTETGDTRFIFDEGWELPTYGQSIILTSENKLSVAGYAGGTGRNPWFDGQIYVTSELPNSVESGFYGEVNNQLLI